MEHGVGFRRAAKADRPATGASRARLRVGNGQSPSLPGAANDPRATEACPRP